MSKKVDGNGFWLIERNPISKAGIYPYLGKQISPNLEPDKIYNVLRPVEELENEETVQSFNGVPLINEHEMLGEGFTEYDKNPAGGVIFNPTAESGVMYADIRIFSEDLKDDIKAGKKDLSLGYRCCYEVAQGYHDGKPYDAVQRDIRGNHIALVDNGRMGGDVRVYDQQITFDSLNVVSDFTQINKGENKDMDAEKLKKAADALKEAGFSEEDIKEVLAELAEEKVEKKLEEEGDEGEKKEEKKNEEDAGEGAGEEEEGEKKEEDKKCGDEEKKDDEEEKKALHRIR